ncbi:MAG: hypothetical protein HP025_01155 [Angelakisella sp.]|nr:hypothetical protein [Angelakisella sp.]
MKKLLSLALALLMLAVMLPVVSMADEIKWEDGKNVYWQAGNASGQTATLADALKAAYMANKGDITITCRPDSDVGSLTHGHVADNITIIGNGAFISSGECDLEVDTYRYDRTTGKQDENGAYLEKNITITASNLYNLGVWGERHTNHIVNINLTNCDGKAPVNLQRVYISGTAGVNNITVTGCNFLTKATALYSNADGTVVIDNCTFKGGQVPVNFNHKADGIQTVAVKNSTFTNCGDAGEWSAFAAPVRFVNSGNGSLDATIENNTFTGTVGNNGDILLGDYRDGETSKDFTATITPNGTTKVRNSGITDEPTPITGKVTADAKGNITPVKEEGPTTIVIINPTQDTPKTDDQKNPATGANDLVAVAVAAAALALAGSAIILRKD